MSAPWPKLLSGNLVCLGALLAMLACAAYRQTTPLRTGVPVVESAAVDDACMLQTHGKKVASPVRRAASASLPAVNETSPIGAISIPPQESNHSTRLAKTMWPIQWLRQKIQQASGQAHYVEGTYLWLQKKIQRYHGQLHVSVLEKICLVIWGIAWFVVYAYQLYRFWYVVQYVYYKYYPGSENVKGDLPTDLPYVTIQLPMFNERSVAERVIRAACELDWPADRLEIQVLDDSTDDTRLLVENVCKLMHKKGVNCYPVFREENIGFKAGALDYGTKLCKGEFIAIFDADFIPTSDFLRRAMPYFYAPGGHVHKRPVGVVQSVWGYLNQRENLLTCGQCVWLDGHFFLDQAIRMSSVGVFNFNGTAGIWRTTAIIDAGGWQWDTVTEDAHLSYCACVKNYQFRFVKDLMQPCEVPNNMLAFKQQQRRWTKGHWQLVRKMVGLILTSQVPLRIKVDVFYTLSSTINYAASLVLLGLAPFMSHVLGILGYHGSSMRFFNSFPFFVMWTYYGIAFLEKGHVTGRGMQVRDVLAHVVDLVTLWVLNIGMTLHHTFAMIEGLASNDATFIRTPKDGSVGQKEGEQENASDDQEEMASAPAVPTKDKKYRADVGMSVFAELLLAVYFARWAFVLVCAHGWAALDLTLVAFSGFLGFAWVSWSSALRMASSLCSCSSSAGANA